MRDWVRPALIGVVLLAATGCSPDTDIVTTNTEAIGYYRLMNVTRKDTMTADVCVTDGGAAADIAGRVVQQEMNKGFRSVTLNLYTRERNVGHAVWTSDKGLQFDKGSGQTGSPCR